MIRAAALSLLLAAPAHAAPVWVDGLGFRWLDATGQIAADDCWDGKAGRPIDCALLAPMPARVVPKPRPPCLTPRTPGCPAVIPAYETPAAAVVAAPSTPRWQTEAPRASAVPAIPLPAPGLLLAAALGLLWRARR
jgi:hypothetical protein